MLQATFADQVSARIATSRLPSAGWRSTCSPPGRKGRSARRPRIAEELGTSDATVVRTAKALGYDGLADLRRALATHDARPPLEQRLRQTLEETPPDELLTACITHHRPTWICSLAGPASGVPAGRRHPVAGARTSSGGAWSVGTCRAVCAAPGPTHRSPEPGDGRDRRVVRRRAAGAAARQCRRRHGVRALAATRLGAARSCRQVGCPVVLITDDLARTLGTGSRRSCSVDAARPACSAATREPSCWSKRSCSRSRRHTRRGGIDPRHAQRVARVARGAAGRRRLNIS